MKGKKGIPAAVLWMAFCIALWGCAAQNTSRETENVPEFVLTYAENQAEDYPTTQGAYKFAELVKERTDGRVEIIVNAQGTLGDERTVIEQMQFGGIDFARVSLSPLSEFVPELNVLQLPYLYTGADHMWKVLEGEIGDRFLNSFDYSGLVALSWYDAGARNFYNSSHSIERLEDMKGMVIRVQESELMSDSIRALGAVPKQMAYGEVYSGLQIGEIDGAENNWPSYESARHFEVARYYTIDGDNRDVIRECAEESARYERRLWREREVLSEKKIRDAGGIITQLTPEEKERFQAAVMPMYQKYCSDYTDVIERIVEAGKT